MKSMIEKGKNKNGLRINKYIIGTVVFLLCLFVLLLLSFSMVWTEANFGNVSLDEIMFHLNMPLNRGLTGHGGGTVNRNLFLCFLISAA